MKHQPYKTVKTKLKNILLDPNDIFRIQKDVETLNGATVLVYQFIKAWCLHRFENNLNLPNIDKSFIKSCFRALCTRSKSGAKPKDSALVAELELFRNEIYSDYKKPDLTGLSAPLDYQIIDMETCYINNIFMHFPSRLRKYIKCTVPLTGTKYENQKRVWTIYNSLVNSDPTLFPEDIKDWYDSYRETLLPKNIERRLEWDLKVNPFKYLWHMIFMNRVLEASGHKIFAAFPLKDSAIPGYITLDTCYIGHNLVKDKKLNKGAKWVSTNQNKIFKEVFYMEKRIFRKNRYNFHYMLTTNGYSVGILFEKVGYKKFGKKDKNDEETIPYGEDLNEIIKANYLQTKIVGADPGKYNLLYLTDGNKKIRYTKNQRMHETGEKKYAKILLKQRRKAGIEELESALSKFKRNTCFLENYLDYIRAKNLVFNQTIKFYSAMWIRAWDFRKFRLKQKSESKFLNKVEEAFGKDCVISYGDWKGNNQLKNQKATLGIGMRNIIERKFRIFLTDEYRTSKLHYQCQETLTNAVINGERKHRCLKCSTCELRLEDSSSKSERSVFVNRDFNAALNICYLGILSLQNIIRPNPFIRGSLLYD